jgi:hypothetical protein
MKKVSGAPKFDSIQLGELHLNRLGFGDQLELKFAYAKSDTRELYGQVTIPGQQLMSEPSRELLSKLVASLEEDAAKAVFPETTDADINGVEKGGLHEPSGIADGPEEADQI